MSGVYGGVQAHIKQLQPRVVYYVHCAAHNLNLVLNDCVKTSTEIDSFFAILESIYIFFGTSIKRWDLLTQFTGESTITLERLNPTRWAGRYSSLLAVKLRYIDIMKALTKIILTSNKREDREEANRIKKNISKFEFIFMCVIFTKILSQTYLASNKLQAENIDVKSY